MEASAPATTPTPRRGAARPVGRLQARSVVALLLLVSTASVAVAAVVVYLSLAPQSQGVLTASASQSAVLVSPVADAPPLAITVRNGSLLATVSAEEGTLAQGIRSGLVLYEGDSTWPPEGQPLTWGSSVWFERSIPFTLVSGEERRDLRGYGATVGEGLASVGVYLVGRDYTIPSSQDPLDAYLPISVYRVAESVEIEQETTSFETLWEPDPELELDQTRLAREGQEGVRLKRYGITQVNGEQVERELEDSWIQQEPLDRLMAYGTKVVVRTVDTPQGPMQYWRKVRVLVTSYSPSTAGTPTSSAHYGVTRSGKRATTGIVAVDPSVIPMGSSMYIPGYGIGVAEDTGSAIIGRHIDVCYDDAQLVPWRRWVDVYLLTPVPPESSIRWVLPNWPPSR